MVAVVLGIALADYTRAPAWLLLLTSLVALLIGFYAISARSLRRATIMFVATIGLFSGCHYAIRHYDVGPNHIANFAEPAHRYHMIGEVVDWPRLRPGRTELVVELDSMASTHNFTPVHGRIMVRLSAPTTSIQRGDRLEFFGRIYPVIEREDPTGFDYGRYLRLDRIFGRVYLPTELNIRVDRRSDIGLFAAVDRIRDAIRRSFQDNLSPIAAALASGFLIGETRDIPSGVYTLFRDTGTLHVLAVSGSNVALVVAFVLAVLWIFRPSRNHRYLILLLAIGLFALLSYEEPSVLRASLMAALVIIARWMGRNYDLHNIISLAALIILLVAPAQLFDVGFQLSFVIAWGLILTTPRILNRLPERITHGHRWLYWLAMTLTVTITAQIFAAPLMLFYFGRFPLLSPLANLVVVPMVSVGVWTMLVTLVLDFIWPALGLAAGALTTVWLESIVDTLRLFISGDNTIWQITTLNWLLVAAIYAALVLMVFAMTRPRWRRVLVIGALLVTNAALMTGVIGSFLHRPHSELLLFRLPGGIGGLVMDRDSRQADLIVTGLYGRDYPIHERIINPILEREGVESVQRLFVISSDYTALEDLLRLADQHQTDSVLVHPRLLPSARDLQLQEAVGHSLDGLIAWTDLPVSPVGDGYYPADDRLLLIKNNHRISFLADWPTPTERWPQAELLVVNARLTLPEDSALFTRTKSAQTIICARIEQDDSTSQPPRDVAAEIIDLARTGYYRIALNGRSGLTAQIPD
jgi:ComEC/Rec2-related protein